MPSFVHLAILEKNVAGPFDSLGVDIIQFP